jgi:hypothetical protein
MSARTNIGYHTRLVSDDTKKVVGGSFGGTINQETVERLVTALFSVVIKTSGRAVFVDKEGREVRLYLSVDPDKTSIGKKALEDYRHKKAEEAEAAEEAQEIRDAELADALQGLSHEEAIRRLRKSTEE